MIKYNEINEKKFQDNLRSYYFEIVSNMFVCSIDKLMEMFTKEVSAALGMYVGVYVSNQWNRTYQLICNNIEEMPNCFLDINQHVQSIDKQLSNDLIYIAGEKVLDQHPEGTESVLMKLDAKGKSKYLLLIFKNRSISKHMISLIKKETDRFMEIIYDYYDQKDRDRKNKFLIELSQRLQSTIDKSDILSQIITSLQTLYPKFSYDLLLSHDYEKDIGLPIKAIEYSDDTAMKLSTKAFATGEIHIERATNQTNLYAPLIGNQGVYGIIQIISQKCIYFPEKEIEFITQFSHTAGKAIESVELYQNSIQLISDLKLINNVTHKLNSNLKFSELIRIVRNEIYDICQASQIGLIFYNQESKRDFDILDDSTSFFSTEQGYSLVKYLVDQIKQKKEPIFSGDYTKYHIKIPYKSVIAIPMVDSGLNYGLIIIMHEKRSFFSFENYKLIQSLIHHSTLALTNAILKDKLEVAVITDYLTKLYSRGHLDEMLNKHMQTGQQGTLILLDIDDFKSVNDTYGHYIGDEVIVQIADIIMHNIGDDDIPTRWGGEEFAIYLPEKNMKSGIRLAEKIRNQVVCNTDPHVTFSCGISSWPKDQTDSVSDVFIRADKALYEAKEMGKNCIVTEDYVK